MNIRTKKIILSIVLSCFYSITFSQLLSENDIKQLAQQIDGELQGMSIGNGITIQGCFAIGRTLIYQYDVTEDWYPPENMKEDLIANFKKAGYSEVYFKNYVNCDFYYYFGNKLQKKVSIKSNEFSNLNFSLGEYISIKEHPKAKGVNLKLKQPNGWVIAEGDRPNIVKKFVYRTNMYMIIIKDNYTFVSRNEARELFSDDEFIDEFISEVTSSLKNAEVINHKIVTIDKYPALEFTFIGNIERSGINLKLITKNWAILYEDKIVNLQCGGSLENREFYGLESLYNLITNSIIFPEQYK